VGLEHGLEGQGNPVCVASSESANRGHAAGDGEMGEGGRVLKVGIDIKMLISHSSVDPTALLPLPPPTAVDRIALARSPRGVPTKVRQTRRIMVSFHVSYNIFI
jgi:hypothetical protein